MQKSSRMMRQILFALIALGTIAGVVGAYRRLTIEARNKNVEIGLEYDEAARLAQVSQQPLGVVLAQFKNQGVTSLILNEDLLASLEQSGQAQATRASQADGSYITYVRLDSSATLRRVRDALDARGIAAAEFAVGSRTDSGSTVFVAPDVLALPPAGSTPGARPAPAADANNNPTNNTNIKDILLGSQAFAVKYEYVNLRSLGLGLPPDNVKRIRAAHFGLVGRIGNFAGVTPTSARAVLERLRATGAKMVIFNGDEVLGYRGQEKAVAAMLRDTSEVVESKNNGSAPDPKTASANGSENAETGAEPDILPTGLVLGEVELSKQKGDEKLGATLNGDYIRVHAIQSAEIGQLEPEEVIDRFVRAARERNIRFCYVRLLTTAGGGAPDDTPLSKNVEYIGKIAHGIAHGGVLSGGGYHLALAARFGEAGGHRSLQILCLLLGLGAAAGSVWALRELCPLPLSWQRLALIVLSVVCIGLAVFGHETGRRLVALLAGIAFPTVACLRAYPRRETAEEGYAAVPSPRACLLNAVRAILIASGITFIGIAHVVGLLSTRPFMLRANQFLGIKAQHAVPILVVAFVALIGGVSVGGESWTRFKQRVHTHLAALYAEPARFGILLIGLVALAAFMLIVARTGNDSGVGASGTEMKMRAVLDRLFPVRPRTKEFLVGHPAFILALAWAGRGRWRLAIPAFVAGSIGQVSLLNTFCHIHTPLIVSLWHGGLGLLLGVPLGAALFLIGEKVLPPVAQEGERERGREGEQKPRNGFLTFADSKQEVTGAHSGETSH